MIKFTIITPTNNSEKTIYKAIKSVLKQTYKNFELLIIDNCSSDQTINTCNKLKNSKIRIVSERDNGIYDAMNKGAFISKGDYLLFLNSDDYFVDTQFLKNISKIKNLNSFEIIYSKIKLDKNIFGFSRYYNLNNLFFPFENYKKSLLPHPGCIIRKDFFLKMGGYNSNLKIAGDFDFFLRCCLKKKINYHFYDKYTVQMALGGASSGLTNVIRSNLEVYKILSKNKIENKFFFIFFKLLSKILNLRLSFLYKKNIS